MYNCSSIQAYVNDPEVINCLRNLVTNRRAPVSANEGTMCFGLLKRVNLFPNIFCAAIIPPCKYLELLGKSIELLKFEKACEDL